MATSARTGQIVLLLALAFAGASRAELRAPVQSIVLTDAFAGRQILVNGNGLDVTRQAVYSSSNPAVAIVDVRG